MKIRESDVLVAFEKANGSDSAQKVRNLLAVRPEVAVQYYADLSYDEKGLFCVLMEQ